MSTFPFDRLVTTYTEEHAPTDAWRAFFRAHPTVQCVLEEQFDSGFSDVTVYFKDSEEPFPLSSLRSDSPLKLDLERQDFDGDIY